jgi:hypothetical protein
MERKASRYDLWKSDISNLATENQWKSMFDDVYIYIHYISILYIYPLGIKHGNGTSSITAIHGGLEIENARLGHACGTSDYFASGITTIIIKENNTSAKQHNVHTMKLGSTYS